MTVVEYEGRIVVVDVGLRFPTAEMVGIDLVLPDFTYLRERVDDIEGIVITHGHEDHLGALPWVLRELRRGRAAAGLRRPADDGDGALQARRAPPASDVERRATSTPGETLELGPFDVELIHMTHSIPDACAVALDDRARHRAGHRRLQVRPDARSTGRPPTSRAWPSSAARACCCCAATRRTPTAPGFSPSEARRRARTWRRSSRAARAGSSSRASPRTSTASSRSSTPPRALGPQGRAASGARCARTSTSAARSGTSTCPRGMLVQPREIDDFPDEQARDHLDRLPGRAAERAAPHGPPRPPAGRAARGRHRRLLGHADPRQRARGQRDDRPALPHRLRRDHDRATRRSTPPATATRRRSS